jgi:hypothetical protein
VRDHIVNNGAAGQSLSYAVGVWLSALVLVLVSAGGSPNVAGSGGVMVRDVRPRRANFVGVVTM